MSRFNIVESDTTTNLAGGKAYSLSGEEELVSIILTNFLTDNFYRSGDETLNRLVELLGEVDPRFAAKAALYARRECGMRSVSHVIAAELGERVRNESWLRPFISDIIVRADDVTEILAYWLEKYGRKDGKRVRGLPNAMRRGLADAMNRFDDYELAKYLGRKKNVSLIDAANLCHPSSENIDRMMKGLLSPPMTWEVMLSAAGNDKEKKAEVWMKLLSEKRLGYLAAVRNARNICVQAPDAVEMLVELLTDERIIRKSRIFPFQFYHAIWVVEDERVVDALKKAVDISLENVPSFEGKTLIAIDSSGSMRPVLLVRAALFAAALARTNDADVMSFSSIWNYYNNDGYVYHPRAGAHECTFDLAMRYVKDSPSGGTNVSLVFDTAHAAYERIIVLTDDQHWVTDGPAEYARRNYERRAGCTPYLYELDLAGYGTTQFRGDKTIIASGLNDRIFDFISKAESGAGTLVEHICAYTV